MIHQDDDELLNELKSRLEENKKALDEEKNLTQQLLKLNKQLAESEKSKSNFISNIRNEIINPFMGIQELSATIMRMEASEILRIHVMAKMIHSAARDLDFQLKNIFEAAAIEAGESIPDQTTVEVHSLIREAVKSLEHKIVEKKVNVELIFDQETDVVAYFSTDPEKLNLIILNLISNAIKFNLEGKTIRIKTNVQENQLVLLVEDDGIGIRKGALSQIFDRFRQANPMNAYEGHGLGLSVTKSLVEGLGGTIEVHNKKTSGTVFTVTLPSCAAGPHTQYAENGNEIFFHPPTKY